MDATRGAPTRALVLAELLEGQGRLSAIAERTGVTVQAVSAHVRALAAAGHVEGARGAYRVTPVGVRWLEEEQDRLRGLAASLAARLDPVRVVGARAATDLRAGMRVALVMEEGDIVAAPGDGESTGRVVRDTAAGEEAVVTDLSGIVPLRPGRARLVVLPAPAEGGTRDVDRMWVRRHAAAPVVGVLGTGAAVLAAGVGLEVARFAGHHVVQNAVERGVDAVLLVTRDRLQEALEVLSASEIVEAPANTKK